jgi:hypothetical protein
MRIPSNLCADRFVKSSELPTALFVKSFERAHHQVVGSKLASAMARVIARAGRQGDIQDLGLPPRDRSEHQGFQKEMTRFSLSSRPMGGTFPHTFRRPVDKSVYTAIRTWRRRPTYSGGPTSCTPSMFLGRDQSRAEARTVSCEFGTSSSIANRIGSSTRSSHDLTWVRSHELSGEVRECAPQSLQMTKRMLNETIGEDLMTLLSAGAA